jgi:glycosyltransferase involved in cell wall biosynthesis
MRPLTIAIVYNAMQSVWWRRGLMLHLKDRGHRLIAAAPFDGHEGRVQALGFPVEDLPMSRMGMGAFEQTRAIRAMADYFGRTKPDLALLYTIKPIVLGTAAARLAGVPRIAAAITGLGTAFDDGSLKERARAALARFLMARALPRAERVLFQNPDDQAAFVSRGLVRPQQCVLTAGSGVDLAAFAPQPPVLKPLRFVFIGRLLRSKGVGAFAAAAQSLHARYGTAVSFEIVGPLDSNLDAIAPVDIAGWEAAGVPHYGGVVDDVRPALARASVFVLPSAYKEGVPRASLEAMAVGRPVITTAMPGCRETVEAGVNGFLVPPHDPVALAAAMERFILEPDLVARMGAQSRRLAETKFDIRAVNQTVADSLGL